MKEIALVISCEHASNSVPEAYHDLFTTHHELLDSHRGLDLGAQTIAIAFRQHFNCDLVEAKTTRLLIDYNRSLHHRQCFSEITVLLSKEEKAKLIEKYYLPFRQQVKDRIKKHIQQGKLVLHLSIHSFAPSLNNQTRNADIGLLYDPRRSNEQKLAKLWQQQLKTKDSSMRIRLNYPYRGVSDGFTTALRKCFLDEDYAGIEVESNQALIRNRESLSSLCNLLTVSLSRLVTGTRQ